MQTWTYVGKCVNQRGGDDTGRRQGATVGQQCASGITTIDLCDPDMKYPVVNIKWMD